MTESQKYFLNKIPVHSKVLILGGGSGWIAKALFAVIPTAEVYYVEASSKMMLLAKKKLNENKRIHFICGTENDIPPHQFDAVVTNFYLDLFPEESLAKVIQIIRPQLKLNAVWIVTDFVDYKWWHKRMLQLMYAFFRLVSNVRNNKLPDWNKAMIEMSGRKRDSMFFYGNFIESAVFQFL
ncbi:MAG: class I SAM-dependent methyltransferase [Bacteroidetes bacterium]|nr:class I SAM-dependent methyltransferase [Bacteroidota bacterium]